MTNLVPFGQYGDRLYTVEDVVRGIRCECVCPDPYCRRPLIARKGDVKVSHFAHAGGQEGTPCSGGETGLHRYAKQVFCEAVGKVVYLPHMYDREFYGGYHGMLRIVGATPEAPILGTTRRCDVFLNGTVRRAEDGAKWGGSFRVAVEIAVTHNKDDAYQAEVRRAGAVSVLEVPLTWEQVQHESERMGKQYHQVVKHILLKQPSSKYWLFKRGGEKWECPGCGSFKHHDRPLCYNCLTGHSEANGKSQRIGGILLPWHLTR